MSAEKTLSSPLSQAAPRHASFFRQSGWLMFANISGGALNYVVHLLNKIMPPGEYGSFGALLAVVILVPTMPIQMTLAQQTAKAIATNRRGELAGLIRVTWLVTTLVWLVGTAVVLFFQHSILDRWQMSSPVGLWITLAIVLISIWTPMFWGVLQGQQNFLWLGWSMLSGGVGRLAVAAFAVVVVHAYAAGIMAGVFAGAAASAIIGAWQTRSTWLASPERFDWRGVSAQVIPLCFGFLGLQILFTADTLFVRAYFDKATSDFYLSAGTMSRALMWMVLPLASVMFPRLVHSAAKAEKTNLMGWVLAGTAVLAVAGAVVLSLLGPWVVRIVATASYVPVAAAILPWYLAAMVPLALANVLLNNLLARPASKLGLGLGVFGLAVGYMFALTHFHASLVRVLQTLGVCNLLLLSLCAWFTWGRRAKPEPAGQSPE